MPMHEMSRQLQNCLDVSDFHSSLKFDCGDSGSIVVTGGKVEVSDIGADCTVTLSPSDLRALLDGELDPVAALEEGRLKVDGDMSVAMRMRQLLHST